MTQEQMEDEIGQHNDQLKLQDQAISEIRAQLRLIIEALQNLEICGLQITLHNERGENARNRITEIVKQLNLAPK